MARNQKASPPLFSIFNPLKAFLRLEAASGILLVGATVIALIWANSPWRGLYEALLHAEVSFGVNGRAVHFSLAHLVNDGLMAVFFFVVGLEIKRELTFGELKTLRTAMLPAIAAVGGVLAPAAIYVLLNAGTDALRGWAIPMATDIAFCVGVLTLLSKRVPYALVVFVTALAIFDDILGIAVIALFYGKGIQWLPLLGAAGQTAFVAVSGRRGVSHAGFYAAGGALLWFLVHSSGIHATVAGVALGLAVPARRARPTREVLKELSTHTRKLADDDDRADAAGVLISIEQRLEELEPPLDRFIHALHPLVAFGIMPVFALANAGVNLSGFSAADLMSRVTLGVALGLFVGKQLGIFAFVWAGARLRLTYPPTGARPWQVYGVAVLAGIGFTVALFIATLAFADEPKLLDQAKLGVLLGSLVSGVLGAALLWLTGNERAQAPRPAAPLARRPPSAG